MKKALKLASIFALLITVSGEISAQDFPLGPQLSTTPGKLCDQPTKYRYPENIAYCERAVEAETKNIIIAEYDQKFGYKIESMNREDFKIDHFIPLCAGGSNDISNLWPQHKSVYLITDPLEPLLCAKMAQGKLKQKDAVAFVIDAKTHLEKTKKIIQTVSRL